MHTHDIFLCTDRYGVKICGKDATPQAVAKCLPECGDAVMPGNPSKGWQHADGCPDNPNPKLTLT